MDRRAAFSLLLVLLVVAAGTVFVLDREAQRRAIAAEETRLQTELAASECVTTYGTSATVSDESASVVGRSLDGWTVRVSHPYWYSTNRSHADASSESVYVVGVESVRYVGGESVGPTC
ncbi:hypothetical protein C5B90_11565 [Haloferax sp. Atlit-12N]|uniref:hypothetical protein n=1 Tax=Haloferax sp. Atlit-12N TaxID=2077203 RepID=UPI000E266949|nr:hypothetical protein [Haloferax sp. Atlit-12N]RDZ63763.1 hypothetical protein C5B90_11565 [Haloferax sp. Atlit-12N]